MRPSPGSAAFQSHSKQTPYTINPPAQASKHQAAAHTRNMLNCDQSPTRAALSYKQQSKQNANLKSVTHNEDSRLRSTKKHYGNLNVRFVASDGEHTRTSHLMAAQLGDESKMSSLMAAKLLAEADCQEFYGRRLRERVESIEQQRVNDVLQMLRLTANPGMTQHDSDGASELDAGHASTRAFNGSETSEDTVYAEAESQQTNPAMSEQQSPEVHALQVDDEQTHQTYTAEKAQWQPYTIAQLTPLNISEHNNETFTWVELVTYLGGNQYSPGLYYSRNDSPSRLLQGRTYWLLEGLYEPFAPKFPGQHGAKLTAFFNDTLTAQGDELVQEDYSNVPVFVCLKPGEGYTYIGQYSQPRFSDKLSYSELFQHVPTRVLEYWAKQLADPHRPAWITEQLAEQFWPKPPYTGPIPTDSALTSPATGVTEPANPARVLEKRVKLAMEDYAVELKAWKKDATMKVTLLSESALMEAWHSTDIDEEKGLRLWWEYMECVGFNDEFYRKLVGLKNVQHQLSRKATAVSEIADISTHSGEAVGMQMQSKRAGKQRHDSVAGPISTGASTIKPKEPTLSRSNRPANIAVPNPYPQADLQAVRELHDKATKAGERKRGRSDKQQTLPPQARKVNC
ncbi:hypothetical protein Q7P35_004966 [Cladosporium inversicolor]